MKVTIQLFIHQKPGQEQQVSVVDMSKYPDIFGALLGVRTIEVEVEPFDIDPTAAMIDALKEKIEQERRNSLLRINHLQDQISQLTAIGHEVAA
jgi:hypothetical protein